MKVRAALLIMLTMLLVGCSSGPYLLVSPGASIRDEVRSAGWREINFDVRPFMLTGFYRPGKTRVDTLHVYIESDGFAFDSNGQPTLNPTPLDPVALNMAFNDPAPAVLYLARPCQYPKENKTRSCAMKYWTFHRFAKEVIRASSQAIDLFKTKSWSKKVLLIGHSGGGAVAALVAAHRRDVVGLITVAGTLDHKAWMDHFKLPKLYGSLNPVDFVKPLSRIPQTHYVGLDDEIMPPLVAQSYMSALKRAAPNASPNATIIKVPSYSHNCCWAENWPELLKRTGLK